MREKRKIIQTHSLKKDRKPKEIKKEERQTDRQKGRQTKRQAD